MIQAVQDSNDKSHVTVIIRGSREQIIAELLDIVKDIHTSGILSKKRLHAVVEAATMSPEEMAQILIKSLPDIMEEAIKGDELAKNVLTELAKIVGEDKK